MANLMDLARLPKTEVAVHIGIFNEFISNAPLADLNIFGLVPNPDFKFWRKWLTKRKRHAFLFTIQDWKIFLHSIHYIHPYSANHSKLK